MTSVGEQALGAVIFFAILLDVFLTVLYARMGTSIIGSKVGRLVWLSFRGLSRMSGSSAGAVLSFCGPVILVVLVGTWALGLTLGAALIMHSELGSAIRASDGETPTDFVTAMYAAGSSMAIVGSSDFTPHTSATRLLYLFNSVVGVSITSLTLTYLMQVYAALQQRNVLALKIDLLSGRMGDAAELLTRLGPEGQFSAGYTNISELGADMTAAKEAHHFYPVLFYFRFRDPYHSVSRSALVALDTVSLIQTALDRRKHGWLGRAGGVLQLREASMMLVTSLEETFIPDGAPETKAEPDQQTLRKWRERYDAALGRLRRAGIETRADPEAGVEAYIETRKRWHRHIPRLAEAMGYRMAEIDVATSDAALNDRVVPLPSRPHLAEVGDGDSGSRT